MVHSSSSKIENKIKDLNETENENKLYESNNCNLFKEFKERNQLMDQAKNKIDSIEDLPETTGLADETSETDEHRADRSAFPTHSKRSF
jgi:hypothetical protein